MFGAQPFIRLRSLSLLPRRFDSLRRLGRARGRNRGGLRGNSAGGLYRDVPENLGYLLARFARVVAMVRYGLNGVRV